MNAIDFGNKNEISSKEIFILILFGIALTIPFIILFERGVEIESLLMLGGMAAGLLLLLNFWATFVVLISLIFVYKVIFPFQVSILFTLFLFVSFILTHSDIKKEDLKSPIILASLLFLVSMLPSLLNSYKPVSSLMRMFNFAAIIISAVAISIHIKHEKQVRSALYIYIFFLSLSSVHVISLGFLTGARVFGFSEVFYIDLAGIGIIITLIFFIESKRKLFWGFILSAIISGLVLTQTRNAWLSVILTSLILFVFLLRHNQSLNLEKRKIISYVLLLFALVFLIFLTAKIFSPGVEDRITSLADDRTVSSNPASFIGNSLLTRLLIWHTAALAFLSHPIIGIGAYSFPFSSQFYYKIPDDFYEIFVRGLTPHHGYLGALTETGVVGFIGLIIFLAVVYKDMMRTFLIAKDRKNKFIALIFIISSIYIAISLFFTQAWLWGQQAVLWGILIGLHLANKKIIIAKAVSIK